MEQHIKILLLEDFPEDAELIKRILIKDNVNANILVVENKTDFIENLSKFSPDIILSDHSLPTLNSIEALEIVKELGLKIPFILVTATLSEEFAVQMIQQGFDDYILKNNLTRLPASVKQVIYRHKGKISEEKAKLELYATHARLMFHLENSRLGYIEWDNQIKVKSISKRAEEIFGFSEEEFKETNKTGYSLIYQDDIPYSLKIAGELLNGTVKSNTAKYRCYTKDKGLIWCEWFNSALKDKNGTVTIIMSLVQDITERMVSESKTIDLVENLKARNKELRQFAHMISHNLRAPITKIKGLSQLFNSTPEEKDFDSSLIQKIITEVDNLDNVIKDMNAIISARSFSEKDKEYVLFETDVNLIKKALENEINESGALITTHFREALGLITVKSYLYSILYNLLSNAIKYRQTGVIPEIHLKSFKDDKFICITVKDNGVGIDLKKNGDKIFGLYKRFHGAEIPGKGIGLSLVKSQTESLGGRVEVTSRINNGTTFKIYLPI